MRDKIKEIRESDGFTIIEVLIVLVIAASIMLLVFLAVPQLQRNSRNQQRKSDISSILTAYSEYTSNNNGNIPSAGTCSTALDLGNGSSTSSAGCFLKNTKTSYYKTASNISFTVGTTGSTPSAPTGIESAAIVTGFKCSNTNTPVSGASRNVIALYNVETGSGTPQQQCQESGV